MAYLGKHDLEWPKYNGHNQSSPVLGTPNIRIV